ncbi:hypothetical protein ACFX15_034265 [Malus domestica]
MTVRENERELKEGRGRLTTSNQFPNFENPEDQSVVVRADRFAIALKSELRDRLEAGEESRQEREEPSLGIEREAVPALVVDSQPPVVDGRASFLISDTEEVKNTR